MSLVRVRSAYICYNARFIPALPPIHAAMACSRVRGTDHESLADRPWGTHLSPLYSPGSGAYYLSAAGHHAPELLRDDQTTPLRRNPHL